MRKVAYEFDPFKALGLKPPKDAEDRRRALEEAAEIVKTRVLEYVQEARSPVSGGKWKRSLSKEYRDRKLEDGGSGVADMELSGSMLNALEVVLKRGNKLSLEITGAEAPKADGHNNHSGRSELPERVFIPRKNETFKRDIWADVRDTLREYGAQ